MNKYILLFGLLILFSCKQDKNYESELDESEPITHTDPTEQPDSGTVLDVAPAHMGAVQQRDGQKFILASDFVKGTFEEDYGKLATVRELFPSTFTTTSRAATDAAAGSKDSIISLKYKASSLEYRKIGNAKPLLINGVLRDETFLLQNGVMTGMTRREVLDKFGIKDDIAQDTIEVRSNVTSQSIVLIFKGGELGRIELNP